MTETLLMVMPLLMLIAAVVQIFLVDQRVFELVTWGHHRLFMEVAYPNNHPAARYQRDMVPLDTPSPIVPVIGFFHPYGLSPGSLRITGRSGGPKELWIGRGTRPDVASGLSGVADPRGWLAGAESAFNDLAVARRLRSDLEQRRRGR